MRQHSIKYGAVTIAAIAIMVCPRLAQAQEAPPEATGPSERTAFQQQGIPVGSFRLFAEARATAAYNDNVLYGSPKPLADEIFTFAPSIDAKSQWTSHELDATAFLISNRYAKYSIENNDSYGIKQTGRVDVLRDLSISETAGYSHQVETEGTPGDLLGTSEYVQYNLANISSQVRKQFDRFGATLGVSTMIYRYDNLDDDGVLVDQHFRDRNVEAGTARFAYETSPVSTVFVTGALNKVHYDNLSGGIDRGSHGYNVMVGMTFDISQILRGDVSVGYISQTFRDPIYPGFHGLDYSADLTYAPTALTSFRLSAKRSITDSSVAQVSGVLVSLAQLSVEHELLRNLLLSANASYTNYDYRGIDLTQNRWGFGAGARYKLSRYFSVALSYDRVSQTANGNFGLPYDSNKLSLSIIVAR